MKKLILICFLFFTLNLSAQDTIPNADFENWYNDSLIGWTADNFYSNKSNDSYTGNYSIVLHNWYAYISGILNIGKRIPNDGIPFTAKPATLTGYYKYEDVHENTSGGAAALIRLRRYNNELKKREIVAEGYLEFLPADNWTPFKILIYDSLPGVLPDTILIYFTSVTAGACKSPPTTCNFLSIDALSFSDETGIDIEKPFKFEIYPNPTNNKINIILLENLKVKTIILYNMQGKIIKTFPPDNRVLNMENIARGKYLLSIEGKNSVLTEKVIVW